MSETRDDLYRQLLHFGLCQLRDTALSGNADYCAIEAEHLHNIPSLIGEANEHRHRYYFDKERVHYLESVDQSLPGIEFTIRRYHDVWNRLAQLNDGT